jgi:ATP-dependent Clp protease ATP-binding subunit ClpA
MSEDRTVFERFTDEARRAVVHATDEARNLRYDHIDPLHFLLGLLSVDGIARDVLERAGLDLADARTSLARKRDVVEADLPFAPKAKQALELALREANYFLDERIGTEHILIGVLRTGDGPVEVTLEHFGTDASRVYRATIAARAAMIPDGGVPRVDRWTEAARLDEVLVYVDERRSIGKRGLHARSHRSLHSTVPFSMMWPPYRRRRPEPGGSTPPSDG